MEDSALVHLVQPSQVCHSGNGFPHWAEEHGPQASRQTGQGRADLIFVILLHKCTYWTQFFSTWKRLKISQNFPKFLPTFTKFSQNSTWQFFPKKYNVWYLWQVWALGSRLSHDFSWMQVKLARDVAPNRGFLMQLVQYEKELGRT